MSNTKGKKNSRRRTTHSVCLSTPCMCVLLCYTPHHCTCDSRKACVMVSADARDVCTHTQKIHGEAQASMDARLGAFAQNVGLQQYVPCCPCEPWSSRLQEKTRRHQLLICDCILATLDRENVSRHSSQILLLIAYQRRCQARRRRPGRKDQKSALWK